MGELWLFLFAFLSCGPPASTLPRWPVNTTTNSVARHSRDSTALLSRPLSLRLFLWNELKTLLVQHPAPANPAELRAPLNRVYHRTWSGSRWMFEKMGAAWVRRRKAYVAANGCFFEKHRTVILRIHIVALKDTAQKTSHLTRHLPLHGTIQTPDTQHLLT